MSAERTIAAPKLELDQIRKDYVTCLDIGDMRSISAFLRLTIEQVEARPTSEFFWAFVVSSATVATAIIVGIEIEDHPHWVAKAYEIAIVDLISIAVYAFKSFWLDRSHRAEKETICNWARKGLDAALDRQDLDLHPLRKEEYKMLRSMTRRHPAFKLKAQPLLQLGIAPRRQMPDL